MTNMPSYPGGPGGQGSMSGANQLAGAGTPPPEVATAVKLWFASIVLGVVGGLLGLVLTDRDAAVDDLLATDATGLSRSSAETAITVGLVVGLGFALVILALQVFFVLKMRAGRNWARIVLTVLAGLSVVSTLIGFTSGFSVSTLISLLSLLLLVAAVVFMFRPAASAYFARGSR